MNIRVSGGISLSCLLDFPSSERSFSCLNTRERTKEKVKAGEKMAENFFAELKQMKYVSLPKCRRDEYLFFNAPPRNFFNAIFSHAVLISLIHSKMKVPGTNNRSLAQPSRHRSFNSLPPNQLNFKVPSNCAEKEARMGSGLRLDEINSQHNTPAGLCVFICEVRNAEFSFDRISIGVSSFLTISAEGLAT